MNTQGGRVGCAHAWRAFTLIEILVVVAIIGVLVSILLPALGRAKHQARGVQCLAQSCELARGMVLYQNDWGCFPAHQWIFEGNRRFRWFNAMEEYLAGLRAQGCPATPSWDVGRNNSYGYNYKYLGSGRDNTLEDNPYKPHETFPIRSVRAPAKTIAFADCDGTGWTRAWGPERTTANPTADQHPDRLGNHGYTLDPTYIPLRSEHTYSGGDLEPYAWHFHRTFLSDRHLGRSNAVFADGHGARLAPTVAYQDNSLWNGLGFDPADDPTSPFYEYDRHVDYRLDPRSGQVWRY